jgi:chorismate mutase
VPAEPRSDATDLASLRRQIDDLDRALIELLAKRQRLFVRATTATVGADGRMVDRFLDVLKSRRVWAEQAALDPDQIEALFTVIIQGSIGPARKALGATVGSANAAIALWHRPDSSPR